MATIVEVARLAGVSTSTVSHVLNGTRRVEPATRRRVLDAIDRHFHEPLRVDALATAAHMSERTLQRLFVRHLGESVGRYVQRLRLAHACRHLVGTDWPIATVAARCGIPNAANFNRQFLAARGMTPGAYRQFFARHGHAPDADAPAPLDTRPPSLERSTGPGRPRPYK